MNAQQPDHTKRTVSGLGKKQLLTLENAQQEAERFIDLIPAYPGGYAGRGIVIPGGGMKYFPNAWVALRILRKLGCSLPVQIWHLGNAEIDDRMRAMVLPYNVEFVDAYEVRKLHSVRNLNGWELKPFSILYSSFKEVLLLDADNVPVVNPEFLFDTPQFAQTGAIFWPDFGHIKPSASIWNICGIPYRDEPEWEAGQIVVDKERCWRALRLAMWYNEHSDFYFQHVLGDKDTYHLAFRKLSQPVSMPDTPVKGIKWTLCQHDFEGNRIFQHRVNDKWSLEKENDRVWGFAHENDCRIFLEELQAIWYGHKQRTPRFNVARRSEKSNEMAREIFENTYYYERAGFDSRTMTFTTDGRVDQGAGVCETFWDLKEENGKIILILSSKSEITCTLIKQERGVWMGQWLRGERMQVFLRPVGMKNRPRSLNQASRSQKTKRLCARVSATTKTILKTDPRQIVSALAAQNIDVRLLPGVGESEPPTAEIRMRVASGEWNLWFHPPTAECVVPAKTIWITSWNTSRLSANLISTLNAADGLIVPSEWNLSCFSCAGGKKPIWIVRPGIDVALFNYAPMNMVSICVFGMVNTHESRSAKKVIDLFLAAFPHEKDVALWIYAPTGGELTSSDPRINIYRDSFSENALAAWLRELTCFISLEQTSGWAMMEQKALAIGRPLLGTRFGGVTEFFSTQTGYPVEFSLDSSSKSSGTTLLIADPKHAISQMQQVYSDRAMACQLGINGAAAVSKFTSEKYCEQLGLILKSVNATMLGK